MKVILLKDDKRYGNKGAIINVSDGFASNFLFPNKIAAPLTNAVLNEAKQMQESIKFKQDTALNEAKQLAKQLLNITLDIKVKSGENGKIFGSVTSREIANALEELGITIDKKKIELLNPIKTIGMTEIKIKLHPQVEAKLLINVK